MKYTTKLKKWATQFTPAEWELLVKDQEFLDVIMDNGEAAAKVASNLLHRKIANVEEIGAKGAK